MKSLLAALAFLSAIHLYAWQQPRFAVIARQPPPAPSQITALEQQAAASPDDLSLRAQLLRLYASAAPLARDDYRVARLVQIEFLIDQHPADPLAGSPLSFVGSASGPYASPADHANIAGRWEVAANRAFDNDKVLLNALRFLAAEDKPQAEELFKRAIAARPPGPGFSSRLGFFYAAGLVGDDSKWSDHCRAELEGTRDAHVLMGTAIALPNLSMHSTGGGPKYEAAVAASEGYRKRATELDVVAGVPTMPVEFQMFAEDSAGAADESGGLPQRLSGNLQEAGLISAPQPVYPALALQAGVQGTVRLEVTIGADGVVTLVKLISGPPLLVRAALEAVQQWKYQPQTFNGVPMPVVRTVDVPFTLPPAR